MSDTQEKKTEFVPASEKELSRFLRENAQGEKSPVYPVGGRTSLQYTGANHLSGMTLSTHNLTSVIEYPARDMTITVEAGLRVAELNEILAHENQELPLDISHSQRATIGGAIACNISGPRRFGQGTFRDYLIGMSAVDAEGRIFHAGGRVVKNVAGYDLCKLLIGARGTLGVLTEVTLKVKPKLPRFEAVWINCDSFQTIDRITERMLLSTTRPVAMEAFTPEACKFIVADARISFPTDNPVLLIAYEGTEKELLWQIGVLRSELAELGCQSVEEVGEDSSSVLLGTLTEFPDGGDVSATFQANMRPSQLPLFLDFCTQKDISAVARMGNGIAIGHLSDELGPDSQKSLLADLADEAAKQGGNLILLNADESISQHVEWWGKPEDSWKIMKSIKHSLDPLGLLNPGATPFE